MVSILVGDKIWRRGPLDVKHYGVYVGPRGPRGEDVVHNEKLGGVVWTFLDDFAAGRPVYVETRAAPGDAENVVHRAVALIGRRFDLLLFNCEHAATAAQEGQPRSGQLQTAALFGGLLIGFGTLAAAIVSTPDSEYDPTVDRYRDDKGRFARR